MQTCKSNHHYQAEAIWTNIPKEKNVAQKCFQRTSVSKFHPEICWLNLLVIKRDSNCVGERIITPVKKWNTEGSSNSHSSTSASTWRMMSSAWFPCTKRLIQLANKLSWFTCQWNNWRVCDVVLVEHMFCGHAPAQLQQPAVSKLCFLFILQKVTQYGC